jgi:hypothetical protein
MLLVPGLASALFLSSIFVATMLTQYRRIDFAYLLYGIAVIILVAGIAAVISSYVFKKNQVLAAILSVVISIALVLVVIALRT